jgi:hypothetical protein
MVLCHNLCVLVQAMYEFGIEPEFLSKTFAPTPFLALERSHRESS